MITREALIEVELADRDARTPIARDQNLFEVWCMAHVFDGRERTCSRHKGHVGIHVDPSVIPGPDVWEQYPFYRWLP